MLKIEGITKIFGGLTAVNDVSLTANQGEIIGLIGPNGAGKTTFFNILTGIYKPNAGRILFEDQLISGMKPFQIANQGFSRTFQNIRLLKEKSVLENVQVGMFRKTKAGLWASILALSSVKKEEQETIRKSLEILSLVGLDGMDEEISGSLSYGNQRRVEIARALVSEPKLLLLDEPTAGMNAEEVEEMSALIRKINANGTTVILIEHNVAMVVDLCDRLAVLDHGVKIADANPDEVIANPAVIEAYIGKDQVEEVSSFVEN
nr:ABC transporter ATP-binding protein [Shimazuella kribbensis]